MKTKLRISASTIEGATILLNSYFFSTTYQIKDGKVLKGESESKTMIYKFKNNRHQIHEII